MDEIVLKKAYLIFAAYHVHTVNISKRKSIRHYDLLKAISSLDIMLEIKKKYELSLYLRHLEIQANNRNYR